MAAKYKTLKMDPATLNAFSVSNNLSIQPEVAESENE